MINRLGFFGGIRAGATLWLALWLCQALPGQAGSPMFEAGQEAYINGDIEGALTLWRPLAEHGDASAQFALATLYYGGVGVEIDLTEASYWFLRAAEQGLAAAQYNLGNAYKRGEGVRRNDRRAVQWWRKAADQGFAAAQFNLATAYMQGTGVARDLDKARALYRQSADNGHYPAKRALRELAATQAPAPGVASTPGEPTACRRWLEQQPARHYTLQLMSSTQRADARAIVARHALDPHAICAYRKDGRQRYMLLYGLFPDTTAARQAIAGLADELRNNKPWIRRIGALRAQLSDTP